MKKEKSEVAKLADKYWRAQSKRLREQGFLKAHEDMHDSFKLVVDDNLENWRDWAGRTYGPPAFDWIDFESIRGVPGIGKTATLNPVDCGPWATPRSWKDMSTSMIRLDEDVIGTPEEERAKTAAKREAAERLYNLAMDRAVEGMLEPLPRSKKRAKHK